MAYVSSIVSNVPTVTAGTSGHLGSATVTEATPQPKPQMAVEIAARLRAGVEGLTQSTDLAGRFADPGPAAVGRFATTRRTTNPTQRNTEGGDQGEARDKDSMTELFAEARPDAGHGQGPGRLSAGLTRVGRMDSEQPGVGRFQEQVMPRPRRLAADVPSSAMGVAFAGGLGRFSPSVGRLSGALAQ